MWWTNPWWLLALVLIIPLVVFSGFSMNHRKQAGQSVVRDRNTASSQYFLKHLTILRATAIVAVILALSGTYILIPSKSRQLVVLFDTSLSIGEVQVERSRKAALKIIKDLQSNDRVALVAFAGQPVVITSWVKPRKAAMVLESALLDSPSPEQTDLQAALRMAYRLFKGKRGNRSVVLFSDGHSTTGGGVAKFLADIRNSGIAVNTIPVAKINHGAVARELQLPEMVHPGEQVRAQWKVVADEPQKVMALVKLDGKVIYRAPVFIVNGENTIPIELASENSGIHRVEVVAEASDGKLIPQLCSGGLFQVIGPVRILVVHGDSATPLSRALAIQGMKVTDLGISQFSDTVEGFDNFGAIVLDNVPALYITEHQQNLLQSYVAGGGGLLVIGGDASLGRGEYYATGLEDILPVQTDAIGIGDPIHEPLLKNMNGRREGRLNRDCPERIPSMIQKETAPIGRELVKEGRFDPVVRTYTPNLSGLEYQLPPVMGYLLTKPKNLATIYLEVGKGDPLLAGWRYGHGQVVVFSSDSGRRWLASWSGTPVYNRFWSQLIRSIERNYKNDGLRASVIAADASAQIVVEAVGADNRLRSGLSLTGFTGSGSGQINFRLKETAPGRYEAKVPLTGSGIQQFNIYEYQWNDWTIGWVWNPPGAEFTTNGPDVSLLGHLSDATGGELLKISEAKPPKAHWTWTPLNLQGLLIVIALLIFLVELGYRSTSFLGHFS